MTSGGAAGLLTTSEIALVVCSDPAPLKNMSSKNAEEIDDGVLSAT
jgi:hypothetical protein